MRKLFIILCMIAVSLVGCNSKTAVNNVTTYRGEGEYWTAAYIYDPDLYQSKKVNWIEIKCKSNDDSKLNLEKINIELKSNDGVITGNIGDMKVESDDKQTVKFLVGTVNEPTYIDDVYQLKISYGGKEDILELKSIEAN